TSGMVESTWRSMFYVGVLPALLAIVVMRRLKEPEQWQMAKFGRSPLKQPESPSEQFGINEQFGDLAAVQSGKAASEQFGEKEAVLKPEPPKAVQLGSYRELFGDPRWRRNAIVGLLMATSGVVGLWGIGFFIFELIRAVFREHFEKSGLAPA